MIKPTRRVQSQQSHPSHLNGYGPSRPEDLNATSRAPSDAVNDIGRTTGCHRCGTTTPGTKWRDFVPDHQRPNSVNPAGRSQVLYPHCLACSREQGLYIAHMMRRGTQ